MRGDAWQAGCCGKEVWARLGVPKAASEPGRLMDLFEPRAEVELHGGRAWAVVRN